VCSLVFLCVDCGISSHEPISCVACVIECVRCVMECVDCVIESVMMVWLSVFFCVLVC